MRPISEIPTPEERHEAKALLDEMLQEFPFKDDASKANALALIITPHVKLAIDGLTPLALISAAQAGTGKTLFASLVWTIAVGTPAAIMVVPEGDELRKQITGLLKMGSELIILDNIEGQLRSAKLSAALTSAIWRDREIGYSNMLSLTNGAIWMATGNNLKIQGDLQRRVYWIHLDAGTVRPWEREFQNPDLLAWALEKRSEIIRAVLMLARAWYADECPRPANELGGFREWSRVVGGIIEHAGWPGFLDNQSSVYDELDEERQHYEWFLTELLPLGEFFVKDLVPRIRESQALQDVLPDELLADLNKPDATFRRRLGKAFSRIKDRRFNDDGLRLIRTGIIHHAVRWQVVTNAVVPGGASDNHKPEEEAGPDGSVGS